MASTIEKHVGSRLAHARNAKGYSTLDLASLLSVAQPHIEEREAGEAGLSLRLVAEAASVLDVPPSFFLEGFQADIMEWTIRRPPGAALKSLQSPLGSASDVFPYS